MNPTALRHTALCLALTPFISLAASAPAEASEGGTSLYVLGSGGPGNAIMPPFEGGSVFLNLTFPLSMKIPAQ